MSTKATTEKMLEPADLPLELPEPCPICGAVVRLESLPLSPLYFLPLEFGCSPPRPHQWVAGGEGVAEFKAWATDHFDRRRSPTWEDYHRRMSLYLRDTYQWENWS